MIIRDELRDLAAALWDRMQETTDKDARKLLAGTAKRLQSATGIRNILFLMKGILQLQATDFDTDLMKLNTPGGLVDLETGEVLPSNPQMMVSKQSTVPCVPGPHPYWDAFLESLTGGDREFQAYLHRLCGYLITGKMTEKSLWFIYGSNSDTGKSTFIKVLAKILGDYHKAVGIDTFMEKSYKKEYDLADLPGARLVTTTEPTSGRNWDEERVKSITGGDAVHARYPSERWINFYPQCKILMAGNHEPKVKNVDDAMLRRVKIMPFNIKVPKEKQIPDLDVKLVEKEGPAILAWMVQGALLWQQEGLGTPEKIVSATEQYKLEQDALSTWITEMCEVEDSPEFGSVAEWSETGKDLFNAWKQWCHDNVENPGTKSDFMAQLRVKADDFGFEESKHTGPNRTQRGFKYIRLRTLFDEDIV